MTGAHVDQEPSGLPAVLIIADIATVLRMSVTSVRRQLRLGTFPLSPMSSPASPNGLDKRYRWARRDVEQYLGGGFRSFDKRAVRLRRSA
jgi:hypothetical protein